MEERRKPQNEPCSLLTNDENERLFSILGPKCYSLAAAVVQAFLTEPPNHSHWLKKYCGVACFIKDYLRKSYFIRIIDFDKKSCVWEQEIYNQFVYSCPCPFFHAFEAENCMAGFNFADSDEANDFQAAIHKALRNRQQRRQEKRRSQNAHPTNAGIVVVSQARSESMPSLPQKEEKHRRKQPKKLTKEDIGAPTDFRHMQHVGWNPQTGFEMTNIDEELQGFFSLAGVSDRDLNDNETRTFIYDFINDHGGIEKAKQEVLTMRSVPPPPPPVREAPPTPRNRGSPSLRSAAPPPPLPPSISPVMNQQPAIPNNYYTRTPSTVAPLTTRGPPPPRPPTASNNSINVPVPPPPPPPPPPSLAVPSGGASAPIPPPPPSGFSAGGGGAPPPPPPPPSGFSAGGGGAPTPPPPPPSAGKPTDSRSALFDQIRKGKALHHVEVNGTTAQQTDKSDDARGALLNQIRRGIELKPVAEESRSGSSAPMQGLAGALARALQERSRAIQQTDESESEDDEDNDDDDWED